MRAIRLMAAAAAAAVIVSAQPAAAQDRPVPYWASITAGDALMRTGPGRNYPALWRYRRAGLPVKVVQVHESWRKVREIDGTEGWMAAALLSAERTALVTTDMAAIRGSPDATAPILWRAQSGVVGRLRRCSGGWCQLDVVGRAGYVAVADLWGVAPDEEVE